jgi:hypothetical protein
MAFRFWFQRGDKIIIRDSAPARRLVSRASDIMPTTNSLAIMLKTNSLAASTTLREPIPFKSEPIPFKRKCANGAPPRCLFSCGMLPDSQFGKISTKVRRNGVGQ